MSNQIISQGSITIGDVNQIQAAVNLNLTLAMTGSNLTGDAKNIVSASAYTPLDTSSLSDVRYTAFLNSGTASIILAGSSVGGGLNPILRPGDVCIMPFSASQQLWANVVTGTVSLLQYGVAEQ